MDVHDKLDELTAAVAGARAVPMSASCVVNRAEVLQLLADLRRALPEDLERAEQLLRDSEVVRAQARDDARDILADAHDERMRLVSETEVLAQAELEGRRITAGAEQQAGQMRAEVDDYIDAKLANFEIVLGKTLEAVQRGRERIQGRRAVEALSDDQEPGSGPPLPTLEDEDDRGT